MFFIDRVGSAAAEEPPRKKKKTAVIANLVIGNVLPLNTMPEGTIICNIEAKPGDRGKLAKCSGDYATVLTHSGGKTRVR